MLAFHNDPKLKAKYLARVRKHRKADRIIQGTGWEYGRGCAVGCTLEAYDHNRYPIELGIPVELAKLEDGIFEGLAKSDAMDWPEMFLGAIPVGADLALVWPRFAHWLLVDDEHGVIQYAGSHERARSAIQGVADLFARLIAGDQPTTEEWGAARAAAGAPEWSATRFAPRSAAGDVARADAFKSQSTKLLELLREDPIPEVTA